MQPPTIVLAAPNVAPGWRRCPREPDSGTLALAPSTSGRGELWALAVPPSAEHRLHLRRPRHPRAPAPPATSRSGRRRHRGPVGTIVEHALGYRARFGYPLRLCLVCPSASGSRDVRDRARRLSWPGCGAERACRWATTNEPGTDTGGEILARDKSGNQTITALPSFSTKRVMTVLTAHPRLRRCCRTLPMTRTGRVRRSCFSANRIAELLDQEVVNVSSIRVRVAFAARTSASPICAPRDSAHARCRRRISWSAESPAGVIRTSLDRRWLGFGS